MKYILIIMSLFLFSCFSDNETKSTIQTKKSDEKQVILALWDSLTAWLWVAENENYPSQLQKKLDENGYNYEVINAWVSWDTSQNALSRASLYLEKKPSIVILVIWWNDWLRWLPTTDLKKNILSIIDTYKDSKILFYGMDLPANLWINYKLDFKWVYEEVVKERPDISYWDFFLEWVAEKRDLNNDDMIHPNAKWYEIIVKNVFETLVNKWIITK